MRRCILLIIVLSFCSFNGQGQLPEKALSADECDISSFPHVEGAENPTVLFDCWTNYSGDSEEKTWEVSSKFVHGGTSSIRHEWGSEGVHLDSWLVSPKIAIPNEGTYKLSFWSYNDAPSYYPTEGNSVWISNGSDDPLNSNDFEKIWSPESVSDSWSVTTLDLSNYAGEEIYIAFRYNATWTHGWYLDDIKVEEVATVDCTISEFPYVEGAENASELLSCWKNYYGASEEKTWEVSSKFAHGGTSSIRHEWGSEGVHLDGWLVSPKIAIPNEGTYKLSFWSYNDASSYYPTEGNSVWISMSGEDPTVDGNDYEEIWSPQSVSDSWVKTEIDLSKYADKEIYIAFRYNATWTHGWYVDDIKIDIPTDCSISSFPYDEGWEEDSFVDCWTTYDIDGDDANACWKIGTDNTHSGSRSIYHNDHNSHNQDGWLVSPKITVPATGHYRLSFWEYNNFYLVYNPASGNKNTVLISEAGNDPGSVDFEPVYSPEEVEGNWVQTKINLDNYREKDIYIAFRYQGLNAHQWWLDDLKIEQIPDYDAGVTAILSPLSGGLGATEKVKIKVKNYGAESLENVPVKLEIDDVVTLTGSVPAIDYEGEVEYEFTQTVDLSVPATYSLKAYTELTSDADAANDSITATVVSVACSDLGLPYNEGASDVSKLLCWTTYSLGATMEKPWDVYLGWGRPGYAEGENCIYHGSGESMELENYDDWFVSPKITIPTIDKGIYQLSFWSWNGPLELYLSGANSVWISDGSPDPTGDENDFKLLWSSESVSNSWEETRLRLADYAGKEIYIAFRYKIMFGHEWYIDDIKIDEIDGPDAAITAITSPVSGANRSSEETITIKVKNLGSTPLSDILVKAEINETTVINGVIDELAVNAETEYSFPDKADLSDVETYNIRVYTLVENDIDTSNDTVTVTVTNNGNVAAIGIDTEVTTCDIRFTDDAIDGNYHGLNQDGKTTQTITFYPAGPENRLKVEFTSFVTKPFEILKIGESIFELPGDTLFIYSGNTPDESQLLLALTDNLTGKLPPVIRSRAEDGSLTFVFDKHKNTEAPGWEANVSCFTPQPKDVGVNKIIAPLTGGNEGAQVKVLIENYGSESASGFSVAYSLDGAQPVSQEFSGTIEPRQTAEFTFEQTVDLRDYKSYFIEAYTVLNNDGDASNDTATVSFAHLKNVELYGYRIYDDEYYDGTMSEEELLSIVSFNSNNPETITTFQPYRDGNNVICAAEYVDGFIYAYTTGNPDDYASANFVKLRSDGTQESKTSAPGFSIADMTYDYSTGTMYVVTLDFTNEKSILHTVDLTSGALTKVADLSASARLYTLAADLNGRLYGIESSGELVEVNKTNGELTTVGNTEIQPAYIQSMTFDHSTGRLFWAMSSEITVMDVAIGDQGRLIELDPATGAATDWGSIGTNAEIVGLHTHYSRANVGVPESPVTGQDLITVYPNPSNGVVYVSAIPDNSSLSIIDLSGKVLETHASVSGTVRLDLHLNSGVYIIRIGNVMKKLLVKSEE